MPKEIKRELSLPCRIEILRRASGGKRERDVSGAKEGIFRHDRTECV